MKIIEDKATRNAIEHLICMAALLGSEDFFLTPGNKAAASKAYNQIAEALGLNKWNKITIDFDNEDFHFHPNKYAKNVLQNLENK